MRRLFLALVLLWPLLALADFQAGYEAFQRGDCATALRVLRPLAEQGHAKGQLFLGTMYFAGCGVAEDDIQAYAWVNLASAQGFEAAQEVKQLMRAVMTPVQIAKAQKLSRELCAKIPNCAQ